MEFHSFDSNYVTALIENDLATQEHFIRYFTELLHIKLRSRLRSPQAIEDVRQETFARVFSKLRKGGIPRQPEQLSAFVNTVCNNVLFEYYRSSSRANDLDQVDTEQQRSVVDENAVDASLVSRELKQTVRNILADLPDRDRDILKALFLGERDGDEVAKEFGVDREYLRVVLSKAKEEFRSEYLRRVGGNERLSQADSSR